MVTATAESLRAEIARARYELEETATAAANAASDAARERQAASTYAAQRDRLADFVTELTDARAAIAEQLEGSVWCVVAPCVLPLHSRHGWLTG